MKVMLYKNDNGYTVYVPKKDLEEPVVQHTPEGNFGGTFTLGNGWELYIEPMDAEPSFPVTLNAKKL